MGAVKKVFTDFCEAAGKTAEKLEKAIQEVKQGMEKSDPEIIEQYQIWDEYYSDCLLKAEIIMHWLKMISLKQELGILPVEKDLFVLATGALLEDEELGHELPIFGIKGEEIHANWNDHGNSFNGEGLIPGAAYLYELSEEE